MGDEHQTFHLDLGFSSHLTHTWGPARETERVLVQTETRRISTCPSVLRRCSVSTRARGVFRRALNRVPLPGPRG